MIDNEEIYKDVDTPKKVFKKERARLNELGVSNTWNLLTKPGIEKKEEKKVEFRGFV